MKKLRKATTILLTAIAATVSAQSTVDCQPGMLEQLVTDHDITSLTVTGGIDARDFRFITDSLKNLQVLNLQQASIAAYENLAVPTIGNEHSYAAGVVPALALAGNQSLTTVVLPQDATSIGTAALAGCPALQSVTLPQQLTVLGDYAFTACDALSTVTLPAGTTTVGQGAFAHCNSLSAVAMAEGDAAQALTISAEAFLGCKQLTSVELGSNVTSMGDGAFAGTGLTVLDLTSLNKLETLGNWVYTGTQLTSATLSPSIRQMGQGVLIHNEALQAVTLPQGLDELGDYALAGNKALTTINLGNIKKMGNYALYQADAIQEITIPASVTFMGNMAMAGMTGLNMINAMPSTVPSLGDDVWAGVDQPSVRLVADEEVAEQYAMAEQWKEFNVSYALLLGDADLDKTISIGDINMMIDIVLDRISDYPDNTDIDQDGTVSISDVSTGIDVIQGRAPYTYIYKTPNTTSKVSINDFSIAPGETRDIEVVLSNDEMCSAVQCDINLPQGLSIVNVASTDRNKNHTISASEADGNWRLLCYSLQGERISGSEGAVFKLTVKADENLTGESTITIDNVVLADSSHPTLYAEATTATVGNTTGINDIKGGKVASVRYYNVAGLEAETPFDGINIVVTTYTDGTTTTSKVIK